MATKRTHRKPVNIENGTMMAVSLSRQQLKVIKMAWAAIVVAVVVGCGLWWSALNTEYQELLNKFK